MGPSGVHGEWAHRNHEGVVVATKTGTERKCEKRATELCYSDDVRISLTKNEPRNNTKSHENRQEASFAFFV
jgi:hypothetical protein